MMNLHYYREVDKLMDSRDFNAAFETAALVDHISEPDLPGQEIKMVLLNRLEAELRYINRKSVYVAMKWLIFIHQVIQKTHSQHVLESISTLLQVMTPPSTPAKIDIYLAAKLINPYKQYLKKLICRRQFKEEEDYNLNPLAVNHQMYSYYNFINSTLNEFATPFRQFTAFFAQEYPYLNSYFDLISSDILPLYQKVLHAFEENIIGNVTFIEVEKMGRQITVFEMRKKGRKELSATADRSNSLPQNRTEPTNFGQITPFPNLQCSNLGLKS